MQCNVFLILTGVSSFCIGFLLPSIQANPGAWPEWLATVALAAAASFNFALYLADRYFYLWDGKNKKS